MQLRDYQQECYDSVMDHLGRHKSTLVVAATGVGKTQILATVARDWPQGRILIVAHRDELIRQAADKVGRICGEDVAIEMGMERSNETNWGKSRVVVTSVQTMSRARRQKRFSPSEFGLVVVDECFPAGTLVDGVPIEDIKIGDMVSCFNHQTGLIEQKPVTKVFQNPASTLLKITFSDGRTLTCTPNHPVFTDRGYVRADELTISDTLFCSQEERLVLDRLGVDCIEVLEPQSLEELDRMCPGRVVYNLEVQDHHNYFADDILVHNCHHITAKSYLKVLAHFMQNPDLRVLGVTATPDRADEEALGQVLESVAYEYEIKRAIQDGWLVPISQQLVWVEGLDFSACRTTAGDLNQGDLAQIMEAEKSLHGVVAPTMDIAGDRKTLVFTASVAQAQRGCEIANRHRPGCAEWVSGETPIDLRRDMLRRYARQEFQFLFNCAIALEGFDDPGIQVIAMARPTKSRSLYSQAIGRATRPLAGVPDGLPTPQERREAIANSAKPSMTVLDFVGNSGRHKLMHATDVLGCEYSEQELQEALNEIRRASEQGRAMDVEEAFERAAEAREEAQKRIELEEQAKAKYREREAIRLADERRRRGIKATAVYGTREMDAFSMWDLAPPQTRGWDTSKMPSPKMLSTLRKAGFAESDLDTMNFAEAKQLLGEVFRRWDAGYCSLKQSKLLAKYGYDPNVTSQEAGKIISALKANGWRRPGAIAVG
jgi:superfamily II DNA or RNA helicase